MSLSTAVPTVLRIDIEPDDHQPRAGETTWHGFLEIATLVERLKARLADRSGAAAHPTWMVRLDPDIERSFGRLDFVVHQNRSVFDRLIKDEDPLGIHVHAHRWDAERRVVFSDYADTAWTTHCLAVAVDAFRHSFGRPARFSSHGGYFLSESLLDAAETHGIEVDITVEPGLGPRRSDASFGAYATAPSADFSDCPRRPYYPSRRRFSAWSSGSTSRPILIVPLVAYDYHTALRPWPLRIARSLLRRPRRPIPLSPWKRWPSPRTFWNLAAQAVADQPARYLALAIRTDAPGSASFRQVRSLLEYLPAHPLAKHLHIVDPGGPEIRALAAGTPGSQA